MFLNALKNQHKIIQMNASLFRLFNEYLIFKIYHKRFVYVYYSYVLIYSIVLNV